MRVLVPIILLLVAASALAAEDRLVTVDTRPGVTVPVYYMKRDNAKATVALLAGGGGNIDLVNGVPTSLTFTVRTRNLFAEHGFNVAVIGPPSDRSDLDYSFRISPEHSEDLHRITRFLKKDAGVPVWLVGTSNGTISATAAAIAFGNKELGGVVLTSSVTSQKKTGAVPYQKLDAIRIPVLVLHHERDECGICVPRDVPLITGRLVNAPVKKEVFVSGGSPKGDPCKARHWHGYPGIEKEVVDIIANWILKPVP
jgi:hypothetical protein